MARGVDRLVMIASSTGGPKALQKVVPFIENGINAPVVIVQHMPKGFTTSLAARLNGMSKIPVSEVEDGVVLEKNHIYLARGGYHCLLKLNARGNLVFKETEDPPVGGLRPCANITFHSLVDIPVQNMLCVVLTGMGADGTLGIGEVRANHNVYTIAQNQETCVVYGMPKAVYEAGYVDKVLPLDDIGKEISKKMGVK